MLKNLVDNIYDNIEELSRHNYIGFDMWDIRIKLSRNYTITLSNRTWDGICSIDSWWAITIRWWHRNPTKFWRSSLQWSNKKVKYLNKKISLIKQKAYKFDIIKKLWINLDIKNFKDNELYNKILEKIVEWKIQFNYNSDLVLLRQWDWWYNYPLNLMFSNLPKEKIIYDVFYAKLESYWIKTKEDVNWFINYTINNNEFDNLPKQLKKIISTSSRIRSAKFEYDTQTISGNWIYLKVPKSKRVMFWKKINDELSKVDNFIKNISSEIFERIPDVAASNE